jgi:hypothetical protein
VELAIVVSGIRRDLGQPEAARLALEIPQLRALGRKSWSARLAYAYAEALLAVGDTDGAREWFARAADLDDELQTDASDRLGELDGVVLTVSSMVRTRRTTTASKRGTPSVSDSLVDGYAGVVCDLDGVVYRGPEAVDHAVAALAGLTVPWCTRRTTPPPSERGRGPPDGSWPAGHQS